MAGRGWNDGGDKKSKETKKMQLGARYEVNRQGRTCPCVEYGAGLRPPNLAVSPSYLCIYLVLRIRYILRAIRVRFCMEIQSRGCGRLPGTKTEERLGALWRFRRNQDMDVIRLDWDGNARVGNNTSQSTSDEYQVRGSTNRGHDPGQKSPFALTLAMPSQRYSVAVDLLRFSCRCFFGLAGMIRKRWSLAPF